MMTPLPGVVALMCTGPHFFTQDNCLLYVDAPHKPAIYLQNAALVVNVVRRKNATGAWQPGRFTFGNLQAHFRQLAGSLPATCGFTSGNLWVHFRQLAGSFPATCRFTSDNLQVHFRQFMGSLPANCRFSYDNRQVHFRQLSGSPPSTCRFSSGNFTCKFTSRKLQVHF